jgi:uncharacterized iron-regulated membrane protein
MTTHRRPSVTYRARRVHRYLGLFIGIQFLLWTVGGLYFSWMRLDAVHGDHLLHAPAALGADLALASPAAAVTALRGRERVDSLAGVELVRILDRPVYRVHYVGWDGGVAVRRTQLADALTGALRPPVGREEAVAIARQAVTGGAPVRSVEYLTPGSVGGHHEYREQPLPAWAVRFAHPEGATAYVPAEVGRVVRVRNDRWRVFDFLWMLHTMDYEGRDDFNNLVLRGFSLLGLVTVLSGFTLFALTSPTLRRGARARRTRAATGVGGAGGA